MCFDRFLVRLGLVLAPFLAPKLVQNRLKIVSRRFLRPYFFKNADFRADLRFPRFFHQNRPQDEAKIGLRSPQDGLKELLFRCQNLMSILISFGLRFGRSWGAFWEPSWHQIRIKNRSKINQKDDNFLTWFLIVFWFFGPSWVPFWLPLGTQIDPKST